MKYWILIHCFLPRSLCQLLLTFSPVHASPAHLYILHLYTHCLPTMTCVTLTSIWLCIWPNIRIFIILFLLLFATHIGWIEYFVCKFDLILPVPFLDAFKFYCTDHHHCCLPLAPVSLLCSCCLPNSCYFCKTHSLSCAVLPSALVKYLVNRIAYDESAVVQRGVMFHMAWNLRGEKEKKLSDYVIFGTTFFVYLS